MGVTQQCDSVPNQDSSQLAQQLDDRAIERIVGLLQDRGNEAVRPRANRDVENLLCKIEFIIHGSLQSEGT